MQHYREIQPGLKLGRESIADYISYFGMDPAGKNERINAPAAGHFSVYLHLGSVEAVCCLSIHASVYMPRIGENTGVWPVHRVKYECVHFQLTSVPLLVLKVGHGNDRQCNYLFS